MRRFFLFAVLCMGYMLTACSMTEIIDMPCTFDSSNVESKGVMVAEDGITSYITSNGRTYEVKLEDVTQYEQEKTDTVSVVFAQLKDSRLMNPTYQREISRVTEDSIEKTKELYRIRVQFDGMTDKVPFYFVQEIGYIQGYQMPYPELNFEFIGVTEEVLPDIKDGEDEYFVSKLTFSCEVQYEGKVVPLTTDIIAVQKKVPIEFDPSVDGWKDGGDVNVDL